jgi:Protein of unknown function (DUF3386)
MKKLFCIAVAWCLITGASAHAHFLFVRILPVAEAGRFAEVYFSDAADAGDPRFIDKIAHTKLWLQQKPGQFEPLRVHVAADRLRAPLPAHNSAAVIGECTYGVLTRPKGSFLLRHYPKAVTGSVKDIQALQLKKEIPFEIQMRTIGESLEFIAHRDGKPIANAAFIAVGSDLKDHKFAASADGKAVWKPSSAGTYAVYTSEVLKKPGVHDGVKYDEIREFTTIAFTWPLESKGAEAKAVQLFQEALDARASWSNFPGFSADVKVNADGRAWKGSVKISAKGEVTITEEDEVVTPWVREQMESMVMHRVASSRKGEPVLRFADNVSDHPLGRLLTFEGGAMASSYRVKERQIMVVNRAMGKVNMTITVIDNDLNAEKKFLPRSYTVQYWNAATGDLQRTESIQNRWTRLGNLDLPTLVTVQTSSAAGLSVKTMSLSQHRLAGK